MSGPESRRRSAARCAAGADQAARALTGGSTSSERPVRSVEADPRSRMALLDLRVARALGRPFIFASHSIGPLDEEALGKLEGADLIVSREPDTHDYLAAHRIRSHSAADLAFLFPLGTQSDRPPPDPSRGRR
jgi:polysaccharide pyruvyl transferase WcaK-like protein